MVLIADSLFVDNQNASASGVADMRLFDLHAADHQQHVCRPQCCRRCVHGRPFAATLQVANNIYRQL